MAVNPLQSLWDTIVGWVNQNASQYLAVPIPKDRTTPTFDDTPLVVYDSYFRVWLIQLFLANSVAWFKQQFPMVNCQVQLSFGNQTTTFTSVAQPPKDAVGKGVYMDYHLTDLIPYEGGIVEIQAALTALAGADYLATAVGVLQQFSTLVSVPLEQALGVAEKVATGTRDLLSATQGNVHLGYHQELTSVGGSGQNIMRPGYVAIILATADQVNKDQLSVTNDELLYQYPDTTTPAPLLGYDYMLLLIEGRSQRDDWQLKTFVDPWNQAQAAYLKGDQAGGDGFKAATLAAIATSPDLTAADKVMAIKAVKTSLDSIAPSSDPHVMDHLARIASFERPNREPWEELRTQLGKDVIPDFQSVIVSYAKTYVRPAGLPKLTADEVFS